jgi:hypothetical protein
MMLMLGLDHHCNDGCVVARSGLGSTNWTPDATAALNSKSLNYMRSLTWTLQTTFSCSPGNKIQKIRSLKFKNLKTQADS